MARDTRQRMIRQAALLFRVHGYAGTGIRDVAEQAGANRGVIYHHFPGGKTELATEVLAYIDEMVSPAIAATCAQSEPVAAVHAILAATKWLMAGGDDPAGCTVAAITLGAGPDDDLLRTQARAVFEHWKTPFQECLHRNGFAEPRAAQLATLLVASLEGGLVLCRAEGSTAPLDDVAAALEYTLRP